MDNILNFVPKVNGAEDVLVAIYERNARNYEHFVLFLGCYNGLTS